MTFTVTLELFLSGAWLDITKIDDDTKLLRAGALTITRGRSDQQGRVAPTEVRFNYLDNNATFDGDNPASPYFRQVGLGTPMRVSVDGDVRAVVEIVTWDPSWDDTDEVLTVAVVGAGILRRLEDGKKPLRSAAYRAFTSPVNDPSRVAYWPFEEESAASTVSSPTPGASVTLGGPGNINFGAMESMSSDRLAQFGSFDTFLTFVLPTWTNTLEQHLAGSLLRWPEAGLLDNAIIWRFYFTGGNIDYVDLIHNTGDVLSLNAYAGGVVVDNLAGADWTDILDNREAFVFCTFEQDGADVNVRVRVTTSTSWLLEVSDTLVGRTLGRMYQMVMGTGSGCDGMGFGHVIVGSNKDSFGNFIDDLDTETSALVTGARGYEFEPAGQRILRLADEEDIPITVTGTASDTERLATQGAQTALEMVYTGSDTDQGILFEQRTTLELEYRTRVDLYNQVPTANLTYGHLTRGFRPAADDLRVTNSVTAQRDGGGTAVYAIADDDWFHWTTQDPPDGAGLRESEAHPSVAEDSQLRPQAAWLAHLGAWREKRFRQVVLELANTRFDTDDRAAVRALDIGDVLAIDTTGAPPYVPYTEIRLIVQGYTETVTKSLHTFAFNTTPADPYEVAQVDSGPGSILAAPIDDNDNFIRIQPGTGRAWSESADDLPYHIQVGGQPMTATSMSTDTPAYIAAGAVASADNASVTPALPAGITPDVAQLLVIWATIRNSGTGTVNTPTGWTVLAQVSPQRNVTVFGRYYVTGDAAPTITFTSGAAGATCMARMFAFSALSMALASGTKPVPAAHLQLNSSAQNIAYPALTVNRDGSVALLFVWKQDDFSALSTPSGFTAVSADATTTGDDAGIGVYYDLTGASAAAGTITVTGGASAISRAVVLALRPLQSADVTRGIAGTATSASPGAEIHGWRMGVAGL
jgi:hypothetical protein